MGLFEPVPDLTRGMSREDCDALRRDLATAGIEVRRVEESSLGLFRIVYHSEILRIDFTITNAKLFRETVAAGLHEEISAKARTLLAG